MGGLAADVRSALVTELHPLLLRICRSAVTPEAGALTMIATAWRQVIATGPADDDALRQEVLQHVVTAAAMAERASPPPSAPPAAEPTFFTDGRWRDGWAYTPVDVSGVRHDPALTAAAQSAVELALLR